MHRVTPRGFTKVELLIVLTIIIVLLSVLIVMVNRAAANARSMLDSNQIVHLHQSWLIAAHSYDAAMPLPSLAVAAFKESAEDFSLNHSANIYSLLTIQHFFTPDLLISPHEVSDHVTEADYDFSAYNPYSGVFWDPSFVMHIDDPTIGANASYAHVVAVGDRRAAIAPANGANDIPILGTRGPDVTNLDPADYHRSPTYRFTKPYDQWIGNIAFSDNHVETLQGFYPILNASASNSNHVIKDNLFSADFEHPQGPQAAADAFLAIYTAATQFTVQDVYDPLLDE